MNADRFLEFYGRISEAPDAVARMRRFVLDLAVRGKLVEQDQGATPLAFARRHTVAAEDRPFGVPASWRWLRLADLGTLKGGGTPSKARDDFWNGDIPWVSPKDMKVDRIPHAQLNISEGALEGSAANLIAPESLLFVVRGMILAHSFPVAIAKRPVAINQDMKALTLHTDEMVEFVLRALKGMTPEMLKRVQRSSHGTCRIEGRDYRDFPFPLPPLAEQHRIVAKVDELMSLCDRLEEARKTREETRDALTAASLARLTAPETPPEDLPAHAAFALDALPSLTARPNQIKPLRQTILNLSVRGKLVEQDPGDEPASELLARIAMQRSQLLEEGYPNPAEARTQQKKQRQQSLPSDLAPLPAGWSWATLQQCSLIVIDCKNKTAPYAKEGIRLIRTTNVRDGAMNANDQKYVSRATYEAWSLRSKPEPGDILITREAPMGEVCIIPEDETICLGQRMMLARLLPGTILGSFLLYSLQDPDLMDRVQDKPLGMTVQHLRVGGVETLLIPLPPLAEQHRIVAKVDALMALCDRLEAALTAADAARARLLEALLAEALEPAQAREAAA